MPGRRYIRGQTSAPAATEHRVRNTPSDPAHAGPVLGSGSRVGALPRGRPAPAEGFDRRPAGSQPGRAAPTTLTRRGAGAGPHTRRSHPMEGVHTAEAVIDNGAFGTRTIRFETGRLARQAAGSAVAYLDDETMVLSATTASQAAQGAVRLLPAHGGRRGADVRRGPHPRLVLPPGGPPVRGRHPDLPADRPPAAPVVRQGPAQRDPGRRSRSWRCTRSTCTTCVAINAALAVDPAVRPAVLRPDRRRPGRADRGPVGRRSRPTPSSRRPPSTWSSRAGCSRTATSRS